MDLLHGCPFCIRFALTWALFIILIIIWVNLGNIKSDYDSVLDSYSTVSIYTKSDSRFWGPVTILCNSEAWPTNTTDTSTYTSCDEYVSDNFDDIDSTQDYFSLYWLTPSEEESDAKIQDFIDFREFVYVYAIIAGVFLLLVACCIGGGSVALAASGDREEVTVASMTLSIAAFVIDYSSITYTLIICNCLSMVPLTGDEEGDILLMQYMPGWGLLIALCCTTGVSCCKSICTQVSDEEKAPAWCSCIESAMFFCFGLPLMGFMFYLFNFADEYSTLLDDFPSDDFSSDYIDTTEYLSELAIVVFAIGWTQCGIDMLVCTGDICGLFLDR